ncbi:GRAM domain-containing protein [Mucor lusitanicus]|uniref:GRAM domain-containing protein n=1 Tax=Mucor circinelloides f. lusitanicus TaxID=29924 RepID=A0A8H4BJN4_MUCCL|nr:GRAM domain-containing protein [Mucor lusitanicus]
MGSDGSFSISASAESSTVALPNTTRFANDKRNNDFHSLFRSVPDQERLIDDYGCALQKEILLQGRVYISEHHLCFNANIFGWITNLVIAFADIEDIEKRSTAIFIPNAILISTCSSKHFLASFLSRDQAYDQMVEIWKASRANSSTIQVHAGGFKGDDATEFSGSDESDYTSTENASENKNVQIKEQTECECSKTDQHFPTVVMDKQYDTTIETMYNLLFNSTFMNKFLCEVEKKVCIGEWSKNEGCVHSRESSYIKYLGGSIGPKSTKCYLKEEVLHLDTTDYVSQLTVTQTPDVPSGGSFSVKTRTCISWCGQGQVRVLVTVLVDFTKSSWLKSTIEKASIDGQQNFYKSLDAAVRKYLDSKRRHRHRNQADKTQDAASPAATAATAATEKQHIVIETLSSILNWLISNASAPTTAQLTAICMAMMVMTNLYIASKMAGVDKQLNQLQHHKHPVNHSYGDGEEAISDEQLQFSRLAKQKLDKQMVELEKMIQKAGQSMEQVTHAVQHQRKRILDPEFI